MVLAAKWLDWVLEPVSSQGAFSQRVNLLLAKTYSAALLLSVVELSINAARQYHLLNPIWFWVCWVLVVAPAAGMFISAYFVAESTIWYGLHAFGVFFTLVTWALQSGYGVTMPPDFTPWIWWNLGMGALSAGFGLRKPLGWAAITAFPIIWVLLHHIPEGGGESLWLASQDAVYTFLFAAIFATLVSALRVRANSADQAKEAEAKAAIDASVSKANQLELSRTAALVHGKVIMTIEHAIEQQTDAEAERLVQQAKSAIAELTNQVSPQYDQPAAVDAESLFTALRQQVESQTDRFTYRVSQTAPLLVPSRQVEAITQATLQAVDNALRHSGGTNFELSFSATERRLKIVVVDDGSGFWRGSVRSSSLGLRKVIYDGMQSVGGVAKLDTRQNQKGTRVVLEWPE